MSLRPDNFLALEPLITAHLRSALSPGVYVLSAADLVGLVEATQPTPAVHVLYRGYRVRESDVPAFVSIEQTWLTVVAVRNLANLAVGSDARQSAGVLAAQVIDAMYQHRFADLSGARPMHITQAPEAGYRDGHFYLPLGWSCPITFKPARN
jgi:hypothetical protein